MVEIYFMSKDKSEQLRLPVPPPDFGPDSSLDVQTATIHSLGEVALIGKLGLRTYSIETYFPVRPDPMCQYSDFPTPAACLEMIENWRASGLPIRLIITGLSMDVNELVSIPEFQARVKGGVDDVWFKMTLQQYRERLPVLASGGGTTRPPGDPSGTSGGVYTVKKGDTLKTVAKKLYGSSDLWTKLAEKNKLNSIKALKIKAGQKLKY